MNIALIILLILLLNAILGCLAVYIDSQELTLFDLISSIISGIIIFIFIILSHFSNWIEDKTSRIILSRRNK